MIAVIRGYQMTEDKNIWPSVLWGHIPSSQAQRANHSYHVRHFDEHT